MDNVLIDFGLFQIKWYSFFIFLAILIGGSIIYREGRRKNLTDDIITDLLFYGILFGILGARIYYVIFNATYYLKNPIEIPMIWNGGLAIHGGIIAGLFFVIVYSKKKKINLLLLLDIIVIGLIISQSIGRWGNFFNQEAYGREVTLDFLKSIHIPKTIIKGMFIDGSYKEPTFLYESIASFIGFLIMITIRKITNIKVGQITSLYLIWYGIERLIIESLRSDSLMIGPIKMAQIVSIISIIIGMYILIKNRHNKLYREIKFKT